MGKLLQFFHTISKAGVKNKMKDKVKKLVEEADLLKPWDDWAWEINWKKRLNLLTKDLSQTIAYLDECSENELSYATELLEELMQYFKSIELIECVERNIKRCKDKDKVCVLKKSVFTLAKFKLKRREKVGVKDECN